MDENIHKLYGNRVRIRICGLLIIEKKVLLVKHQMGPAGILWSPPGGGLEHGESIHACLKREFKEESGLEVEIGEFAGMSEFIEPPLHAIELFFKVFNQKGKLEIGKDTESDNQIISDVAYMNFDQISILDPLSLHAILRNIPSFTAFDVPRYIWK